MAFKLVRIDTQEPSKIQLTVGKQIIGRGGFLHNDATDKRVSRNHAELEVTDDSVTLKSLHQNPCFYIKKSTTETQLLQINCTIYLSNGDKFGLLPDNFWYEVLYCNPEVDNSNKDIEKEINKDIESNSDTDVQNQENHEVENNDMNNEENSQETVLNEDEVINFQIKEELEDSNRTTSPVLLNQESTDNNNAAPQVPSTSETRSPLKRSPNTRESSPTNAKKVKTEPVTPGNDQAGPSNDANQSDTRADAPASPVKPPAYPLGRERCIYGANCYRRNPQHKAQFSHPSDSDWGGGARGCCPYGASCRRREPRHWTTHDHPPGTRPPQADAPRPGKKRRQRVSVDSEDSVPDDLIVTGKRTRKPVNRQDWGSEFEQEDEDPFDTDGSDEWQPPSDATNSQAYSMSQD